MKKTLTVLIFLLAALLSAFSQESKDSLVRLISGGRARLIENESGEVVRMVEKNAEVDVVFFHNNTNLLCDTARWNVTEGFIDALGNVRIVQGDTRLTGDKLHYISSKDLAEFRGSLVELSNKKNNILRTHFLDYNTKDSIALFYHGASMKDEDGNVIESKRGSYDSKTGIFEFLQNVEMYSDSLFFRTDKLIYDSEKEIAYFYGNTKAWKQDNHLSAEDGWYDLSAEVMEFQGKMYVMNTDYEGWCEKAHYEKIPHNLNMYDDIQILDTVNQVIVLGDELIYQHDPRKAELRKNPIMVAYGLEAAHQRPDTAFIRADQFLYEGIKMCDVDSLVKVTAQERFQLTQIDPFAEVRKKAAEEKLKNTKKSERPPLPPTDTTQNAGQREEQQTGEMRSGRPDAIAGKKDSLDVNGVSRDSLQQTGAGIDSLSRDSLALVRDTTLVDFLKAFRNIKIYKNDIQVICDSLEYTSLDSITRLYINPIIWYENQNQLTADSVQFILKNQVLEKGYLMSNAFVVTETEEKGKYYNQIKSPEMVGYFVGGVMKRMDALGGVSAMFFFADKDEISTVNMKETRMMTANLVDGNLQRILNVENLKNDAHPVWELTEEQKKLRGFSWQIEKKLNTRFDVTDKKLRKSIRKSYMKRPIFPRFNYTQKYFGEYLEEVMLPVAKGGRMKWIPKRN